MKKRRIVIPRVKAMPITKCVECGHVQLWWPKERWRCTKCGGRVGVILSAAGRLKAALQGWR